ncbi:hypothetical protein BCR34DRAFT_668170 [Clohesyomyces aquaticus]|uniref:Uncharacterized protein n=1 Tax=Clohesyomyces aquaticus TaxID=1231657 RepID=A0A1Y1YR78_9PLEO|nr:hypothetical protein BCR34DRAFT_668170 [Clohesyomyces aquaticus]
MKALGVAPLITSILPLLLELIVRWIDRKYNKAKFFTNFWYLAIHSCLFALSLTVGVIGIIKHNLAYSIASYQIILMHIAGLQMFLLRAILSSRKDPLFISIQVFFALVQLTGGVLTILNALPKFQSHTEAKVGVGFLNAGGGGYYAVLGTRFVRIIGDLKFRGGFIKIFWWSLGKQTQPECNVSKKPAPLVFLGALTLVAIFSVFPFAAIQGAGGGAELHFIASGTVGFVACLFAVIRRWKRPSSTAQSNNTTVDKMEDDEASDEIIVDHGFSYDGIMVHRDFSNETTSIHADEKGVLKPTVTTTIEATFAVGIAQGKD